MEKMKAIAVTAKKHVELINQEMPVPGAYEVLVKVQTSMLCTWEQRIFSQVMPVSLPFIGGHEFAGIITAIGASVDEKAFPIGAKCTGSYIYRCGVCDACRRGDDTHCIHKKSQAYKFGKNGLAEYTTINYQNVFVFPDNVPFERIMFTEPLACVISAHDKFKIELGDEVVIQGAGIMGLMHAYIAKLEGARVSIADLDETRRNLALKLGVCDRAINPITDDIAALVQETIGKRGFDIVINTTAVPKSIEQSIDMCAPGGTFLMFGKVFPNQPVPININKVQDASIKIVGTMSGDIYSFERARKLLSTGRICPEEAGLLSGMYSREDAQIAYEQAILPVTFRVGIDFRK